jgi:hypothetical protein
MRAALIIAIVLIVVVAVVVALNVRMRRAGYAIPGRAAVRCKDGHLFRTMWVEGGAFTAVRLGLTTRYMRCPVGNHWAIVHPVKEADLTDAELAELGPPT